MRTKDPLEATTNFSSRQNMDGQLVLRKNVPEEATGEDTMPENRSLGMVMCIHLYTHTSEYIEIQDMRYNTFLFNLS